jgi:hypothetical protein
MGEAADRKVTEIDETRQRIEADLGELEARLPAPLRSTKSVVGVIVGITALAALLRQHGGKVWLGLTKRSRSLRRYDRLRDVEYVVALGNHDGVEINIAMNQPLMDVESAGGFVEKIFARLQRPPVVDAMPDRKSSGAANDPGRLQLARDATTRVSRMQKHKCLARRRNRLRQRPSQPSSKSQDSDQNACEDRAHLRIV